MARSQDEIIRDVAELIAGLAVPISMHMPLGRAEDAWTSLHRELAVFGWVGPEVYEAKLRERLGLPELTRPAGEQT